MSDCVICQGMSTEKSGLVMDCTLTLNVRCAWAMPDEHEAKLSMV